ncbi:MAG: lysine--tRNA ligase [Desulfurococcales archaeon]|nr:lysine--tRNA ligase [Desulfurococcales archaeon]
MEGPERGAAENECKEPVHWLDKLASDVEEFLKGRGKSVYVFNGGLSVSGLQHIGRLRGEILIPEAVRRVLESRGYKIRQLITIYTQDPWKGKRAQREQFSDPQEARKYIGWPLIRVPDPKGCHDNWVEHYWADFGPYLPEFTDGKIEAVTTTELYKGVLRDFILKEILPKRKIIRDIINKYRGRKPYPENWIPVEPICQKCGRIDTTVALEIKDGKVRYRCRNCGYEGWRDLSEGKLNWRLEWASIWRVLDVDFEPYGKDHATPGGSRDSCVDLARNALGFEPPTGEWYEWVSIREKGRSADMSSSGFTGITPREWLEVAHPQILRFLYFYTHPHKKVVVDLNSIPNYYDQYYRAERVYFGLEEVEDCWEREYLRRTYELSHPRDPPSSLPIQVPYLHASILAQLLGPENLEAAIERLRRTGHVKGSMDSYSRLWLEGLLKKSYTWVMKYGPEQARVEILEELDPNLLASLRYRDILCRLATMLEGLEEWNENLIKDTMIEATRDLTGRERREFYKEFYKLFTGKPYGPRAAPLLSLLPKEFVVTRLSQACK